MRYSLTQRLIGVLEGWYKPGSIKEAYELARIARRNKLYLAYLRRVKQLFVEELEMEEGRYDWYLKNTIEVLKVLSGLEYALYKFRRPYEHVSVDLDILVSLRDIPRAVGRLKKIGFVEVLAEPYTITLGRSGFVVDLYTQPTFAWIIYMDGEKLLKDHVEIIEVGGIEAPSLTKEAEVAVSAAHSVYKEQIVLLLDCLTLWKWYGKRVENIALDLNVHEALVTTVNTCLDVAKGAAEAPVKLAPELLAALYSRKSAKDRVFRATSINIVKYMLKRPNSIGILLWKITRTTY